MFICYCFVSNIFRLDLYLSCRILDCLEVNDVIFGTIDFV